MTLKQIKSNIQKLFSKKKSNSKILVFIDKDNSVALQTNVEVILSPTFYWVKKEQLPVKKATQAKKLLPAIFDGSLPEGEYKYIAENAEESGWFYIYAYDELKIADELESLNVDLSKIKKIHFAQSYIKECEKAVDLNNGYALVNDNGILCRLPKSLVNESIPLENFLKSAKKHKAPSIFISKRLPFSVDPSTLIKFAVAIFIVAVLYVAEYAIYLKTYNDLLSKNSSLYEKYNIPKTGYQRRARIKKLESIKSEIISQREILSKILRVPLNRKDEFIQKLSISGKRVAMEIVLSNNQNAEKIKRHLERFLNLKSVKVKAKIMRIKAEI